MRSTSKQLLTFAFLWGALIVPSGDIRGAPPDVKVATIRGQVGIGRTDGTLVPAESAKVYVLLDQEIQANGSFAHASFTSFPDSAGTEFHTGQERALGSVKKNVKEIEKTNSQGEWAGKIAEYYLKSRDAGLAAANEWVGKHPDKSWQIRTATPDERGLWSAQDLKPGTYDIVVRGHVGGRDGCWEATVDLRPGETKSLPLDRPRFLSQ
jgi:hypothetical protein